MALYLNTLLTMALCTACDSGSSENDNNQAMCQGGNSSVTLQWLAPTTNNDGSNLTNLSGYTLYYGTSSTNLSGMVYIDEGLSTYEVAHLSPEESYYFAITSVNSQGVESDISNIICR